MSTMARFDTGRIVIIDLECAIMALEGLGLTEIRRNVYYRDHRGNPVEKADVVAYLKTKYRTNDVALVRRDNHYELVVDVMYASALQGFKQLYAKALSLKVSRSMGFSLDGVGVTEDGVIKASAARW